MDGFFRKTMKWVRNDPDGPVAYFRMRDHQVVQVVPPALRRSLNVVRKEFKNAGLAHKVVSRAGSALYEIRFRNDQERNLFMADYSREPIFTDALSVQWNDKYDAMDVIPEGAGKMLYPEVRAYKKHESPTTEIAIWSKPYEDVYVAMRPALGQAFVNMLVVVFPLVSLLWTGALIMIIGGVICLLPAELAGNLFRAPPRPAGGLLMVGGGLIGGNKRKEENEGAEGGEEPS